MLSFLACVIFVPWWERTSLAGPVLPEQERRETLGFCLLLLYGAGWGGCRLLQCCLRWELPGGLRGWQLHVPVVTVAALISWASAAPADPDAPASDLG